MKYAIPAMIACVAGTAAVASSFDPQKLASGAFRLGKASAEGAVLDIAHGKTATISIEKSGEYLTIKTNGKADAVANIRSRSRYGPDEVTMIMLGAIPLMLHDAPRRVANIGLGSGITADTILGDPRVERLDTIEIEPKVVELAKHFGDRNRNVYEDPRSVVHIDDAKSFFASNGKTYDLIVSEPSDPWVSGVSSLFSVEFYRHVARFLNEGGLFAQWLPIYETNPDRVASILKAATWMTIWCFDRVICSADCEAARQNNIATNAYARLLRRSGGAAPDRRRDAIRHRLPRHRQ
jgi:hypothetical protein